MDGNAIEAKSATPRRNVSVPIRGAYGDGQGKDGPPAAKGLAPFGMAFVLAAGATAFGWEPTISLRALAKPRIMRDRTQLPGLVMLIACGASKQVDTN
jgi:hypothetical protein